MKSRTTIKKERFTSIVNSKKLSDILTAYFDVSPSTSFKDLVNHHNEVFEFWAHEFDFEYDDLIKLCNLYYNEVMKFTLTDRKIMTGYDESYGSWIIFGNKGLYIMWDLI